MTMTNPPQPKRRWYRLTPDRFLIALLPIVGLLFLSERFRWFPFNEHKGLTVLIAVAVVCLTVLLMLLWLGSSLVFRRRFQFSLRSMMLFVTVVAVVCSWFAVKMQQENRQREVVERAEKGGGFVWYDYQFVMDRDIPVTLPSLEPPCPLWFRNLVGADFLSDVEGLRYKRATDAELVHLNGLTGLKTLGVNGTEITDAGLVHLRELTGLESLYLHNTRVTDSGFAHLKGLTGLYALYLGDTRTTDTGLMHLKGLTNLEMLWLNNTEVTDAGLVHLKGLTSLEWLSLYDTQITDTGLEHLKGLTNLAWLNLRSTKVTDDGMQDLQKALPNCDIFR